MAENDTIALVAQALPTDEREAFLRRVDELLRNHPGAPTPWQVELAIRVAMTDEASAT